MDIPLTIHGHPKDCPRTPDGLYLGTPPTPHGLYVDTPRTGKPHPTVEPRIFHEFYPTKCPRPVDELSTDCSWTPYKQSMITVLYIDGLSVDLLRTVHRLFMDAPRTV